MGEMGGGISTSISSFPEHPDDRIAREALECDIGVPVGRRSDRESDHTHFKRLRLSRAIRVAIPVIGPDESVEDYEERLRKIELSIKGV